MTPHQTSPYEKIQTVLYPDKATGHLSEGIELSKRDASNLALLSIVIVAVHVLCTLPLCTWKDEVVCSLEITKIS